MDALSFSFAASSPRMLQAASPKTPSRRRLHEQKAAAPSPSSSSEDSEVEAAASAGFHRRALRRTLAAALLGVAFTACVLAFGNGARSRARATLFDARARWPSALFEEEAGGAPPKASRGLCDEGEEEFLGLCYKSCSALTGGDFPLRSAPEICCRERPCLLPSQVRTRGFFPCTGFDVNARGGCPRAAGHCDANEEYHLGLCYKKCDLVTTGEYPIRVAANTCCKARPCWNPFHLKTEGLGCNGFGVGGGSSDGRECAHRPQ